ncbi:OB-fold domain-containing protein [Frankia sp. AiPa1]|uniref:Zn-ribbon domain-containing OB-fold protein n=1 Tax=Frankia sp. AiPa1 TaxID=573492 RepID=UPI00202B0F3B|nr:OB-fold domain-containing protein [Frankia sp. AiPa1]
MLEREDSAREAGAEQVISGQPHVRVIPPSRPAASADPLPSVRPRPAADAVRGRTDPVVAGSADPASVRGGPGDGGPAGTRCEGADRAAEMRVADLDAPEARPADVGAAVVRAAAVRAAAVGAADVRAGAMDEGEGVRAVAVVAGGVLGDEALADDAWAAVTGPQVLVSSPESQLWAAVREERFVLGRCPRCLVWLEPQAYRCGDCAGPVRIEAASAAGVVAGFLVVRHPDTPVFAGRAPYALVLVELDEGLRLSGRLDGVPAEQVAVGQPVRAALAQRPGAAEPHVVFHPRVPATIGAR